MIADMNFVTRTNLLNSRHLAGTRGHHPPLSPPINYTQNLEEDHISPLAKCTLKQLDSKWQFQLFKSNNSLDIITIVESMFISKYLSIVFSA